MRHGVWLATLWLTAAGAATIQVTVTDSHDQPLAGVSLRLSGGRTLAAQTDAAGRHGFDGLGPGGYQVEASRAGYTTDRARLELRTPRQTLTARLRLEAVSELPRTLAGVVRGEPGRPVVGVEVELLEQRLPYAFTLRDQVTSDAHGEFLFRDLPPGRYRLQARAVGLWRWPTDPQECVLQPDGVHPPVVIAVSDEVLPERLPVLRLRAVDGAGRPLASQPVQVRLDTWGEADGVSWTGDGPRGWGAPESPGGLSHYVCAGTAKTDAEGRLEATLYPGIVAAAVWGQGPMPARRICTLTPGGRAELTFRVERPAAPPPEEPPDAPRPAPATVRLQVLRPDGQPLARHVVYLLRDDRAKPSDWLRVQVADTWRETDADGWLESRFHPTGRTALFVKVAGYAIAAVPPVSPESGGAVAATVRLQGPAGRLAGRVTDRDGRPLAGVCVFAWQNGLLANGPDQTAWEQLSTRPVYDYPGQPHRPIPAGQPPARGGELPGLLRWGLYYTLTGADGAFAFGELEPVGYHLFAAERGWDLADRDGVQPGETPVSLVLPPLASLAGLVRDREGRPLPGLPIGLHLQRGQGRWDPVNTVTDADGRYRVDGLAAGEARVTVWTPKRASAQELPVSLRPGETTTADLTVIPPAPSTLRGQVLAPDGSPVSGAWVALEHFVPLGERGLWYAGRGPSVWTDAQGRFALAGLEPGDGWLVAGHDMAPLRPQRVRLPAAEPVTIRLERGVLLAGTVRDEQGAPVKDASLAWADEPEVKPPDGPAWQRGRTDLEGAFLAPFAPLGRVRFVVETKVHRWSRLRVQVTGDPAQTADLTLVPIRFGRLRGQVFGADGAPAAGVEVTVEGQAFADAIEFSSSPYGGRPGSVLPRTLRQRTDREGRFRFEQVPEGQVTVSAWLRPGRPVATAATIVPDQEATVELRPATAPAGPR